eukprot:scaffold4344_cov114-Isochrysis_galbana.AAC.2
MGQQIFPPAPAMALLTPLPSLSVYRCSLCATPHTRADHAVRAKKQRRGCREAQVKKPMPHCQKKLRAVALCHSMGNGGAHRVAHVRRNEDTNDKPQRCRQAGEYCGPESESRDPRCLDVNVLRAAEAQQEHARRDPQAKRGQV